MRENLPNGVTILVTHYPGYGTRPCDEIRIIHVPTNHYLEPIDVIFSGELEVGRRVERALTKYKGIDESELWEGFEVLSGCAYGEFCQIDDPDLCKRQHEDLSGQAFTPCTSCGGDTLDGCSLTGGKTICLTCKPWR